MNKAKRNHFFAKLRTLYLLIQHWCNCKIVRVFLEAFFSERKIAESCWVLLRLICYSTI